MVRTRFRDFVPVYILMFCLAWPYFGKLVVKFWQTILCISVVDSSERAAAQRRGHMTFCGMFPSRKILTKESN